MDNNSRIEQYEYTLERLTHLKFDSYILKYKKKTDQGNTEKIEKSKDDNSNIFSVKAQSSPYLRGG